MIIKRIYETYYDLMCRDEKASEIILKYVDNVPEGKTKEDVLKYYLEFIIYQCDLGGDMSDFPAMCRELDELDKISPYDNGLSFRDVTSVEVLQSSQGQACMMVMWSRKGFYPRRIVQIVPVEYNEGKCKVIEPWDDPDIVNCLYWD